VKLLVFITSAEIPAPADFAMRLRETATSALQRTSEVRACVLNLADVQPLWPSDPAMGALAAPPACDALLELWLEADASVPALADFAPAGACCAAYRVEETVDLAGPPKGVRAINGWTGFAGIAPDELRRRWDALLPLSLRVQAAASSHVRDWVVERLTLDAPPLSGITSVGFASAAALGVDQYDSPEAAYALLEAGSAFMADEWTLFARVERLR